jgi:hypothetical protein
MTSLKSWLSWSLVFESTNLEESKYQIWSYMVEIDRSTQWLPVLNGTKKNLIISAVTHCLDKYATTSFQARVI